MGKTKKTRALGKLLDWLLYLALFLWLSLVAVMIYWLMTHDIYD